MTSVGTISSGLCMGLLLLAIAVSPARAQSANTEPDPLVPDSTVPLTPIPTPADEVPTNMQPNLTAPAVSDNYRIGKNDLLTVFIYQMPELTTQVRVDSDGQIRLPMLHRSFTAEGRTTPALAAQIAQGLVDAGLARAPQVQVMVRQVMSRPIVVTGAVRAPMVIQASRPMRLLEVLARAGGLQQSAGTTVILTRPGDPDTVIKEFDIDTLLQSKDLSQDPELTGGETVRVIPAKLVYAVGALRQPGAFPLHAGEPISILKALALSQGFGDSPDKQHSELIHTNTDGVRTEIPLNLDKILKHRAPDMLLQPGDILYVPQDGKRKALLTVLQDAGQATVIAVGYHGFY